MTLSNSKSNSSTATTLDGLLSQVDSSGLPQVSWHKCSGLANDQRGCQTLSPDSLCFSRDTHRVPFSETLHIVGLEIDPDDGQFVVTSDRFVAIGRDISSGGISFRHDGPIPHRFVAVSFREPFGTKTLVVKLSWSRFTGDRRYLSGGGIITKPQLNKEKLNIDRNSLPSA